MSGRGLTIIARADGLRCSFTSPMASVMTSEFIKAGRSTEASPFALIEQKGIVARLVEEVARAASEIARDPRGFIRDLVTDETRDKKRQRQMRLLLAGALVFHLALLGVIVVAGWRHLSKSKEELRVTAWVPTNSNAPKPPEDVGKEDLPRGDNKGGGGSGQQAPQPATQGVLPRSLPQPPIIKPNAPTLPEAKLLVPVSIQGPETAPPPIDAPLGVPTGKLDEPPSPGTGKGGNYGDGEGSGAGPSKGPGGGPGENGGQGGNKFGSPTGSGELKEIPYYLIPKLSKENIYIPFGWTYRARPIVTPEAQEHKIIGTVLVRATLRADGIITDIEVINPVDYMTESAIESLKKSRFRPASFNGRPITLTRVPLQINVHY